MKCCQTASDVINNLFQILVIEAQQFKDRVRGFPGLVVHQSDQGAPCTAVVHGGEIDSWFASQFSERDVTPVLRRQLDMYSRVYSRVCSKSFCRGADPQLWNILFPQFKSFNNLIFKLNYLPVK